MPRLRPVWLALLLLGAAAPTLVAHPGSGIVVDRRGTVYFIDTAAGIWRIEPGGALVKHGGPNFHWLALDERGSFASGRLPSVPGGEITPVGARPTLLASSDVPLTVGPDGSLYYPEYRSDQGLRIIRFTPSGAKSVHASIAPPGGALRWINGITADARGSLYFTDDHSVKKIDSRGTVSTVASNVRVENCTSIPGVDAATQPYLRGLSVAGDGTIYVAASGCGAVLKITSGKIAVVSRTEAPWSPTDVAAAPGGGLYVLEYVHTVEETRPAWVPRVRRVARDGTGTILATVTRR